MKRLNSILLCGLCTLCGLGVITHATLLLPPRAASAPKAAVMVKPTAAMAAVPMPSSMMVTSSLPVMFMMSPALTSPFVRTGLQTNRMMLSADQAQAFIRGILENFPVTNLPVTVGWIPSPLAARYRIYFGQASSNYTQMIEVVAPPAYSNQCTYATSIWRAWGTNYCNMTCLDSNGVESAFATEISYSPQFHLTATRN